ncbi:MAG: DMT family transporter [Pseudomonadota bacterium]
MSGAPARLAPPSQAAADDPLGAAAWMAAALLCFSAMAVAAREAAAELDTFEVMAWRSLVAIVITLAALTLVGRLAQVRARRLGLHALRNIAHFIGQNFWLYAVAVIPLAQLFAYEFTFPIWVLVLAPLVLGERFTRARALSAAIGFGGILIVAQPWAGGGASGFGVGQIAALGAAVGFAFNVMLTKMLSRTETTASILVFMSLMQGAMGFAAAGWDGDVAVPSQDALPWVVAIAACGLGAHWSLASALALAPATVVAPMEFLRLPLIAVVGMVLYGEPLEIAVMAGAAVVFGANLLNLRAERRAARAQAA